METKTKPVQIPLKKLAFPLQARIAIYLDWCCDGLRVATIFSNQDERRRFRRIWFRATRFTRTVAPMDNLLRVQYRVNGKLHRMAGPAEIDFVGSSRTIWRDWYHNGRLRNFGDDGYSRITPDGWRVWLGGRMGTDYHRTDGPARVKPSQIEFKEYSRPKDHGERVQYRGVWYIRTGRTGVYIRMTGF